MYVVEEVVGLPLPDLVCVDIGQRRTHRCLRQWRDLCALSSAVGASGGAGILEVLIEGGLHATRFWSSSFRSHQESR
jgi:hypothetical protein